MKEKIKKYLKRKYGQFPGWQVDKSVEVNFSNSIIASDGEEIRGVAFYIMVNRRALWAINEYPEGMKDPKFFAIIRGLTGKHMHVFCLAMEDFHNLKEYASKVVRDFKPVSLSWVGRKSKRINFMRIS